MCPLKWWPAGVAIAITLGLPLRQGDHVRLACPSRRAALTHCRRPRRRSACRRRPPRRRAPRRARAAAGRSAGRRADRGRATARRAVARASRWDSVRPSACRVIRIRPSRQTLPILPCGRSSSQRARRAPGSRTAGSTAANVTSRPASPPRPPSPPSPPSVTATSYSGVAAHFARSGSRAWRVPSPAPSTGWSAATITASRSALTASSSRVSHGPGSSDRLATADSDPPAPAPAPPRPRPPAFEDRPEVRVGRVQFGAFADEDSPARRDRQESGRRGDDGARERRRLVLGGLPATGVDRRRRRPACRNRPVQMFPGGRGRLADVHVGAGADSLGARVGMEGRPDRLEDEPLVEQGPLYLPAQGGHPLAEPVGDQDPAALAVGEALGAARGEQRHPLRGVRRVREGKIRTARHRRRQPEAQVRIQTPQPQVARPGRPVEELQQVLVDVHDRDGGPAPRRVRARRGGQQNNGQ